MGNTEKLTKPTAKQLSKKLKMFYQFFTGFLKSKFNFEHFQIKYEPHSLCFSEIIDGERRGYVNIYRVTVEHTLGESTC